MVAAMTMPGLRPSVSRRVDGPAALAVLDFAAAGEAEMACGQGGTWLAADWRLDAAPEHLKDDSALATFLERGGVEGLGRLDGDFALATWDPRRRVLVCARDGMGVRPLFHAHVPGKGVAFASFPRGLFPAGLVERALNYAVLVGELLLSPGDRRHALFQGVERLLPGHWLRVDGDGVVTRGRHWRLDPVNAGRSRLSPQDAAAELSWRIEAAVRRRLPADGPVAAHLSGGLDSSAMAILAARALGAQGRKALAYSMVPAPFGPYGFGGDGGLIAPVLRQEPALDWTAVHLGDPAAVVVPHMAPDLLVPDDPALSEVRIPAEAGARGARVLLSGWGGDEGASYTHRAILAEALLRGRWGYLAAELRHGAAARHCSPLRLAAREMGPYLVPGVLAMVRRRRGNIPVVSDLMAGLLNPDAIPSRLSLEARRPPDAVRLRLDLLGGAQLPRRMESWAVSAAGHGIQMAYPLLDRQVVEFAISLPSRLFLREGWSRRVFRDAMAGVLPDELRWKLSKSDLENEAPVHMAAQRDMLLSRLEEWRDNADIAAVFRLAAVRERLLSLPSADAMARMLDGGGGERLALAHAVSLSQAFRAMSFLAPQG